MGGGTRSCLLLVPRQSVRDTRGCLHDGTSTPPLFICPTGTFTREPPATIKSAGWVKFLFWEGGTQWDAFFTCASAQVGQVILALPHSLRQTGLVAGVALLLLFATLAMWTVYLMTVLYLDVKNRAIASNTWFNAHRRRSVAVQYHEVMGSLSHRYVGVFSRVIVIIALGGLAVAQIIASSSNFHALAPAISKRDWALVFGAIALIMSLLPTFRNFREFCFGWSYQAAT